MKDQLIVIGPDWQNELAAGQTRDRQTGKISGGYIDRDSSVSDPYKFYMDPYSGFLFSTDPDPTPDPGENPFFEGLKKILGLIIFLTK